MACTPRECGTLWKVAYPCELMGREEALLNRRPRVGVALSGGGIRSATFGFGVIQEWAKTEEGEEPEGSKKPRTLAKIDVLSTVSGGGYTGSLISRFFSRDKVTDTDDVARAILPAREPNAPKEGIPSGAVLRWLRDNGRYIAPNGSGDLLLGGAIIVRNWISIHVVLTTLALAVFVAMQVVRNALHFVLPEKPDPALLTCGARVWSDGFPPFAGLEAWLTCQLPLGEAHLWWSPWMLPPTLIFVMAVVPFAWAYWLAADHSKQASFPPVINPLWGWLLIFLIALFVMLTSILIIKDEPWITEFFKDAPWITDAPEGAAAGGAVSVAAIITLAIFGFVKHANGHLDDPRIRNSLSSKLKTMLVLFGAALALGVIDTLGQTVYAKWQAPDSSLGAWLGALLGGLVAVAAGGRRVATYFSGKAGGTRVRPTLDQAATVAAVLLLAVTLTAINAVSHGIVWGFKHPRYVPEKLVASPVPSVEDSVDGIRARMMDLSSSARDIVNLKGAVPTGACAPGASPCPEPASLEKLQFRCADCTERGERIHWGTAAVFVLVAGLSWLFGRSGPFLNNSTLLPLYTARLVRAYLGASNPERINAGGAASGSAPNNVTRVMKGDDMMIKEKWWSIDTQKDKRKDPFVKGAPLHLVNVTVNESLDGRSRVQQNDRRGIGMAVGPAGISAGVRHHVVFPRPTSSEDEHTVIVFPDNDDSAGWPFRMFEYVARESRLLDKQKVRYGGRHLSLGQWAGISGAAFSTGIGSRTSLGLSFIAGFFNVRLGFWWDSGVDPGKRDRTARSRLGEWFTRALPVQSYLLDEFFARFHGTARRWWYLSDGGHFENTGAYELIRRRLPLIVIIDAGADPDYTHEDLANLIRKARIDFDAEIEFLDHEALRNLRADKKGEERFKGLAHFGSLEMLRRGPWEEEPIPSTDGTTPDTRLVFGPPDRPRRSLAHAALARVRYEDRSTFDSLIVYIKPTLVGNEPPDITHYQTANQDFPQQTTADQFFDEAQWESYRKLGRLITKRVFPKGFAPYLDLRDNWPLPESAE